eukprot:scaffold3.g6390.t1
MQPPMPRFNFGSQPSLQPQPSSQLLPRLPPASQHQAPGHYARYLSQTAPSLNGGSHGASRGASAPAATLPPWSQVGPPADDGMVGDSMTWAEADGSAPHPADALLSQELRPSQTAAKLLSEINRKALSAPAEDAASAELSAKVDAMGATQERMAGAVQEVQAGLDAQGTALSRLEGTCSQMLQTLQSALERTGALEGRMGELVVARRPPICSEMATQTSPRLASPQPSGQLAVASTAPRLPPPVLRPVQPAGAGLAQAFLQRRPSSAAPAKPSGVSTRRTPQGLASASPAAEGRAKPTPMRRPMRQAAAAGAGGRPAGAAGIRAEQVQARTQGLAHQPMQPQAEPPSAPSSSEVPRSEQVVASFSRKRKGGPAAAAPPVPPAVRAAAPTQAQSLFDSVFGELGAAPGEHSMDAAPPAAPQRCSTGVAAAAQAWQPPPNDSEDLAAEVAARLAKHKSRLQRSRHGRGRAFAAEE